MYKNIFLNIINMIFSKEKTLEELNCFLVDNVDCEEIYEMDDVLIVEVYFTIKHYVIGEESLGYDELKYLKECLEGKRVYNVEEKMRIQRGENEHYI